MKKLMLFMAGIAMSLGTHAQFSLDAGGCGTAYWQPCLGTTGYAYNSSSLTDAVISDVHGALNSTSLYHYEVGDFDNSGDRDIYLIKKNRLNGATVSTVTFDANTAINSNPATYDNCKKMTVDENNHKAYITGTWGPTFIPFLACINLNTNTFAWGKSLNTYQDIKDVAVDASGNVYVLVREIRSCNTCPLEFSILKYSSGSTFLGSWSTSSFGSSDSYFGNAMEYDGSGKIFVVGQGSGATWGSSFLLGINTSSMSFHYIANLTSYPFDKGGFNKIGRNPTNGHIVTAGEYTTPSTTSTTWQEWDVTSNPTKYGALSPTALPPNKGLSGISSTSIDILTDLLVNPNGKVDILIVNGVLNARYLTYINPALNSGLGDIDYSTGGGNAIQFSSTDPQPVWANKDEDGSIIVGGTYGTSPSSITFTAKFHDASLTTGTGAWPGYENKSTGINHIHADEISIAPNPASDILSIEGINDNADYRISNTLGQIVAKGSIGNSKNAQIGISGLNQGTYYLQLYSADKSIITTKPFVKQ
ncbi:MAG: T9SS type A sorting domain-containing protein [Bacteroidetes bacterium]|nr:T9SS type A sorting domain-containing protein [Bacteroidota bacterium]